MEKKKNKKIVSGVIAAAVIFILIGLFMGPCFYYVNGQIRLSEPDEIDLTKVENPGNLDERSLAINELNKWAEKKSLYEIIKEKKLKEEKREPAEVIQTEEESLPEETEDIGIIYGETDPKKEYDEKYANEFVGKERGASEEFFKDTENRQIILNYGAGSYDITDCVVKWMYGEPVVSLNKISKVMGLTLTIKKPDGFINLRRSETYLPEDAPELDQEHQYNIYLVSPQGDAIRYMTGSTIQEDNDNYAYLNTFQVEGSRSNNYETIVAINEVPYYDGTTMKAGVPVSYEYEDSKITITFGDPEDSIGYLALERHEITEEEYKARRPEKATDSNIEAAEE